MAVGVSLVCAVFGSRKGFDDDTGLLRSARDNEALFSAVPGEVVNEDLASAAKEFRELTRRKQEAIEKCIF